MRSEITADNKDSIAAKTAIVMADGKSSTIRLRSMCCSEGKGSVLGIWPKRDVIVSPEM
ncbi:MAG: hypothetical protein LVR00_04025 [Rhabdochlamydiaceae bacterium]|jgi:hypothetical protein